MKTFFLKLVEFIKKLVKGFKTLYETISVEVATPVATKPVESPSKPLIVPEGHSGTPATPSFTVNTYGGVVDNALALRRASELTGVSLDEIRSNPGHPKAPVFIEALRQAEREQLMAQPAPFGRYPDGSPKQDPNVNHRVRDYIPK